MSGPLVTVITAVRNGASYLEETIASIQAQDCGDWEYIIVDDASTDDTAEIVRRARCTDSRVILLRREEAGGPYTAANDALRISRGTYIMRTDADDLQPPHRFRRQVEFMEGHPGYRACVTYWQAFDENGLIPGHIVTVPRPRAFKWYLLLRGASIHSSLCIERDALLELGGYRELPLSQDYRLWCDLTRRHWLGVLPEVLSYVRFHENRATNQRAALQRRLAEDILMEHWASLAGEPCSAEDVESLWIAGYSLPYRVGDGLKILRRWDRLWRSDPRLDREDRRALQALSTLRRRKLIRANLRRDPAESLRAALKFSPLWPVKVPR